MWEGDKLVTYDIDGFRQLVVYYSDDTYQEDND